MRFKALLTDDDAVSPVIGVILMVAITVILAAVIASFVLGLGPGSAAPTAQFGFNYDGSNTELTITHDGGDTIVASQLFVTVEDSDGTTEASRAGWTSVGGSASGTQDGESAVVSGDEAVVGSTTSPTESAVGSSWDATIIWESEDGSSSQTLADASA